MTKNEKVRILDMGGERKRMDPFLQGIKEGAVKKGVDKISETFSLPVAEAINAKLLEMHPNMALTAPMIQSGMQAAIILGLAELLDLAGPRIPGDVVNKAELGAKFMRKYAGEKVGSDAVDYAIQFLPMIMSAFDQVSETDLMEVLDDEEECEEGNTPAQELFIEEDEVKELQKEEVLAPPVKRKVRRKKTSS